MPEIEPWRESGARSVSTTRQATELLTVVHRSHFNGERVTANAAGGEALLMAQRIIDPLGRWDVPMVDGVEVFDDLTSSVPLVSVVDRDGRTRFIGDPVDAELERLFG